MREILFRGKRTDGGEWVYGYLYQDGLIGCNIFQTKPHLAAYIVDPSTVGQYTGLTDKNGQKIFEGDIVERKGVTIWEDYEGPDGKTWSRSTNKKKDELGVVRYDDSTTQFTTHNPCIWLGHYDDMEVIGNIHDNPELLKEAPNERTD